MAGMLVAAGAWAQEAPPSQAAGTAAEGYVWAGECKACHAEIYDSWSKTKHARTINRLSAEERKAGSACIGCHVTGPREPVDAGGEVVNASVQCESCHGSGKTHVEAAKAGNAASAKMVKSPPQRLCETCHNDKSPHYRGFFFAALKGLVHKK
jgi:RecJ-like exonuclease